MFALSSLPLSLLLISTSSMSRMRTMYHEGRRHTSRLSLSPMRSLHNRSSIATGRSTQHLLMSCQVRFTRSLSLPRRPSNGQKHTERFQLRQIAWVVQIDRKLAPSTRRGASACCCVAFPLTIATPRVLEVLLRTLLSRSRLAHRSKFCPCEASPPPCLVSQQLSVPIGVMQRHACSS